VINTCVEHGFLSYGYGSKSTNSDLAGFYLLLYIPQHAGLFRRRTNVNLGRNSPTLVNILLKVRLHYRAISRDCLPRQPAGSTCRDKIALIPPPCRSACQVFRKWMAGCRAVPALALTLMFWLVEHIQGGPGVHGQVHGCHSRVQGRPGVHGQVYGHHRV
jgi:hypothetical protein